MDEEIFEGRDGKMGNRASALVFLAYMEVSCLLSLVDSFQGGRLKYVEE